MFIFEFPPHRLGNLVSNFDEFSPATFYLTPDT